MGERGTISQYLLRPYKMINNYANKAEQLLNKDTNTS